MSVLSSENELERTTENKKWSFHSSLTEIRKCFVNGTQVGLVDETIIYKPQRNSIISSTNTKTQNDILAYYIFDQYSTCLSYSIFSKFLPQNNSEYVSYETLNKTIFTISKWFTHSLDSNGNSFKFNKLKLGNIKLYIISKNNIVIITLFRPFTHYSYCKLISLHLYMTFINYINENLDYISFIYDNISDRNWKNFTTIVELKDKINKNIIKNYYPFLLYQNFYAKYLSVHFTELFSYIVKKDEIILPSIHFKNIYIINLNNSILDEKESSSNYEILFDLRISQTEKKFKKTLKNKRIFNEVVFQAKKLLYLYSMENKNKFNEKDLQYKFIKLELTSTYPRLTFIIKFIPVLKGICIIHMYSQKKLSRQISDNGDTTRQTTTTKENHNSIATKRKEFDILYAQELKNDNSIEFKYTEPQKMTDIDSFMKEFFICIRDCDLFNNQKYHLSYFNQEINTKINNTVKFSKDFDCAIKDVKALLMKMNEDKKTNQIDKSILSETNHEEEGESNSLSLSQSSSILSSSHQFKSLLKMNKFYILSLIFSPIEINVYQNNNIESLFNNDISKSIALSQNSMYNDYTLTLSKIEKPTENYCRDKSNNSITINQSKSISVIKERPLSIYTTKKVSDNLEQLLDESSMGGNEIRGTTLLTKTSTEHLQGNDWDKRIVNQQLIIMDDNDDDYNDCVSGHKFVEFEVKTKKTTSKKKILKK